MGTLLQTGAIKESASLQTAYATGKLRLFKSTMPPITPTTPRATFLANECDYSGYTPGGQTVTAWNEPMTSGIGAQIVSPTTQFNFTAPEDPPTVTGDAAGFWYEDSTGVPRIAERFDDPVPMATDTDSVAIVMSDYIGNG